MLLSPLFNTTTTTLSVGVRKATHSNVEFTTELNILVEPRGVNLLQNDNSDQAVQPMLAT